VTSSFDSAAATNTKKKDGPNEWNVQDFGEYDVSLDKGGGSGLTMSVIALTLLVQCHHYRSILPAFGVALSFLSYHPWGFSFTVTSAQYVQVTVSKVVIACRWGHCLTDVPTLQSVRFDRREY